MSTMSPEEAQEHRRQVLDDQVQITRTIAAATMTPASLLAYARAELARCAALPVDPSASSGQADELPF